MEHLVEVIAPKHCSLCLEVFEGREEYEKHQSEVHRKGKHICEYCYKSYNSKHKLITHIENVHGPDKQRPKCPYCEKSFKGAQTLFAHVKLIHSQKMFSCDQCDEKFARQNSLDRHNVRTHSLSKNFPCSQCDKNFLDMKDVKAHTAQVHSDFEPYQCDMCPSKFKRNASWRFHRKTHLDVKNFECPVCLKRFKHKTGMQICLNRHDNPEGLMYPCTTCESVLKTKSSLKKHIENHIDRKRPACPICTRTLTDNSNLSRHLKNVHGNQAKNFECSICSLKWATRYKLGNHMKIHSGEVFSCSFEGCKSKSNTQYGINFHVKKKHGQVNHRKPIEELEQEWNKKFTCEICKKSFKLRKSPLHTVELHRRTHENQQTLDCIVSNCTDRIILRKNMTNDKTYNLPIEFYKHLETKHAIAFDQFQIQATFSCKLCEENLILRSVKQSNSAKINFLLSGVSHWNYNLKAHMVKMHRETQNSEVKDQKFAEIWSKYFERKQISLEKVEPPTFIDQLLAEKICKLNCDFQVATERWPSIFQMKLLKHYSLEHFGAELMQKEEKYFKGKHFPICIQCDFEIGKQGSGNLATMAVHIGVTHSEIVPILTSHFTERETQMRKASLRKHH